MEDFFVVGIGASAGGTEALTEFFKMLPVVNKFAFVVITHLTTNHRSQLDAILQRVTTMPVIRVTENQFVLHGHIYLLTEDRMMTIRDGCLHIRPRQADEIINRAIDTFFITLAEDAKQKAIAVILSGMGNDGVAGVQAVSRSGGRVLVQQPESAAFKNLPLEAIRNDSPEAALPPEELACKLLSYAL